MTKLRKTTLGLIFCVAIVAMSSGCGYRIARKVLGNHEFSDKFGHTEKVMVSMTDGTELLTRIHVPKGDGPWPTILARNPYNMLDWFGRVCRYLTYYGYACVEQDVRGRYGSDGTWEPLMNERADGIDTLHWLVKQPFQDGNIALFGPSYLGAVQWAMADQLPPEVKTIIPMVISTNIFEILYQRGMFRDELFTFWAALMPDRKMNFTNGRAYQKAIRHYPPIEIDELYFGGRLEWLRQWQSSPDLSADLWTKSDFPGLIRMPSELHLPVLMLSGWYDLFTKGQLQDFQNLANRAESKLVIGPWTHLQRAMGDKEVPNDQSMGDQLETVLDWLDHHLKGAPLKQGAGFVETYAMNEGNWRRWKDFPPETENLRLYLGGLEQEEDCARGALAPKAPTQANSVSYPYDPRNPVPTRGGGPMLAFVFPGYGGAEPGSVEQPEVCYRPDVISFVSQPLEQDWHIAGPITVTLTVSSTAEDTAFTAKLIELTPEGEAYNIRDSITSLAYRNTLEAPESYTPGTPVDVRIEMWPIEWVLKKGERLRVDISSSNFPAFHAHANRAGPWALQEDPIPARQTLHLGPGSSSFVELPIWREEAVALP